MNEIMRSSFTAAGLIAGIAAAAFAVWARRRTLGVVSPRAKTVRVVVFVGTKGSDETQLNDQ